MTANGYNLAFAANPVLVRLWWPDESEGIGGTFRVIFDGDTEIYSGRFEPPLELNLSELAMTVVSDMRDVTGDNDSPLVKVGSNSILFGYTLEVEAECDRIPASELFRIRPGGVSLRDFRRYAAAGTDAFAARFLNRATNFFLTTRTASRLLVIPETELVPLVFMVAEPMPLRVTEVISGTVVVDETLAVGIHALDLRAVRRRLLEDGNVLGSVFDVSAGGESSCRIVVGRERPSRFRTRLKFRNSLGVFDIISCTGSPSLALSDTEGDDDSYSRYEAATDSFITMRDRRVHARTVTLETGVRPSVDFALVADMLASEEVWLLDVPGAPVRVIPKCEDFSFGFPQESPKSFTLSLEVADGDLTWPEVAPLPGEEEGGVFSEEFSEEFN